jgi:hypothetical protein
MVSNGTPRDSGVGRVFDEKRRDGNLRDRGGCTRRASCGRRLLLVLLRRHASLQRQYHVLGERVSQLQLHQRRLLVQLQRGGAGSQVPRIQRGLHVQVLQDGGLPQGFRGSCGESVSGNMDRRLRDGRRPVWFRTAMRYPPGDKLGLLVPACWGELYLTHDSLSFSSLVKTVAHGLRSVRGSAIPKAKRSFSALAEAAPSSLRSGKPGARVAPGFWLSPQPGPRAPGRYRAVDPGGRDR